MAFVVLVVFVVICGFSGFCGLLALLTLLTNGHFELYEHYLLFIKTKTVIPFSQHWSHPLENLKGEKCSFVFVLVCCALSFLISSKLQLISNKNNDSHEIVRKIGDVLGTLISWICEKFEALADVTLTILYQIPWSHNTTYTTISRFNTFLCNHLLL